MKLSPYTGICPGCQRWLVFDANKPDGWAREAEGKPWKCNACVGGDRRGPCRCPMLVGGGIDHVKGCSRL